MKSAVQKYKKRQLRIRSRLKRFSKDETRLRFSVYRSNQHIYAQLIDDVQSKTIVSASTVDSALKTKMKSTSAAAASEEVGKELARRAKKAGVSKVYFVVRLTD